MSVATNVTISVNASPRLVRTMRRTAATSIRFHATMNRIAAIDATGRNAASGRTNSRISNSSSAEKTTASGVRAPAA